jgi:hypothetical protein
MNPRTRPSSRRIASISRSADAQALRAARGLAVPAAVIDTLSEQHVDTMAVASAAVSGPVTSPHKTREQCIAEAAYLLAEQRGFEPGHALADWLAAEKAVDALLAPE